MQHSRAGNRLCIYWDQTHTVRERYIEKRARKKEREANCAQAADNFLFTQFALKMDWSMFAAPFANMMVVFRFLSIKPKVFILLSITAINCCLHFEIPASA